MRLTTPHNILSAYSRGEVSKHRAMSMLGLDSEIALIVAMADVGHALPRPDAEEVDVQVEAALPLLRAALIAESRDA